MASERQWFQHDLYETVDDETDGWTTIEQLDGDLQRDRAGGVRQFVFFDFDDTLHHTATSARLAYGERLDGEQLAALAQRLRGEGVFFNADDPPVHPHLVDFVRRVRSRCDGVLLLSAGSGVLACPSDADAVDVTLLSSYARLWYQAAGCSLFDVLGTDESLLPADSAAYLSPSAFAFARQIEPAAPQQAAIDCLFDRLRAWRRAIDADPAVVAQQFRIVCPALADLAASVNYLHYAGVVPVSGCKRDALVRYFYQLYRHRPDAFAAGQRCHVYFVDDQRRYLADVAGYADALILASLRRHCPDFADFVLSDRFVVKTYRMPTYRPKLHFDHC